jgi:TRAP-type C4-dicarboxylate transport system substrate-binding protein
MLVKNGVAVSEPSPELKAALAKIGEQMAAEWEKSAGADGQAILKAYRGK